MTESTGRIRVVSINGDQLAVEDADGDAIGYVGPLSGGGWFAVDGLGKDIPSPNPRRGRREAIAAVLAHYGIDDPLAHRTVPAKAGATCSVCHNAVYESCLGCPEQFCPDHSPHRDDEAAHRRARGTRAWSHDHG